MKRSSAYANISVFSGLLSIVPLLNLVTAPLAVIFGSIALVRIKKHPRKYAGEMQAIIGIVLGTVWILLTLYALVVFGPGQLLTRT